MITMINVFVYNEWTYYIYWIFENLFDANIGFNTKNKIKRIFLKT
jgi:hypothetical protein